MFVWYMKHSLLLNMRASKKKRAENYSFNSKMEYAPTGFIDSQKSEGKDYRLANGYVKNNGCGAVALYNIFCMLKNRQAFSEVLHKCEDIVMLKGLMGCNSYRINEVLEKFGYRETESFNCAYKKRHVDKAMENKRFFIATYWNSDSLFKGAHIVAGKLREDGSVRVYNAKKKEYASFEQFKKERFGKRRFMALYGIKEDV